MATTKLAQLVNPQVLADLVEKKLHDLIRFLPLATVDTTLVGRPGDTLTLPSYAYIGDAEVLAEGEALTPVQLTASTVTATVHKLAQGVELTDEAVLSGYGDPLEQAAMQIATAIANGYDNEMLAVLDGITGDMAYAGSGSLAPIDVNKALEKFGEDIDNGENALVCSPRLYTEIRNTNSTWIPASEIAADRIIRGAVGEIFGCQVMVSNKLKTSDHAFIVKPGALRVITKRETLIESDRDILAFKTVITGSKHAVTYLYDASKAIKLSV